MGNYFDRFKQSSDKACNFELRRLTQRPNLSRSSTLLFLFQVSNDKVTLLQKKSSDKLTKTNGRNAIFFIFCAFGMCIKEMTA